MKDLGFIYFTDEVNSDGEILTHKGLLKKGIGKSKSDIRRFHEHHQRGSKSTVGVNFSKVINCNELNMLDDFVEKKLHQIVLDLGFKKVNRISHYDKDDLVSTTEVFSGISNKNIDDICEKGEQLSDELLIKIINHLYDINLFKLSLKLLPHQKDAYKFMMEKFGLGYKEVLLNHKPRSGKSFICYHYMIENPQDVLLFTNFPIVNGQWKSEFEMLRDHDYNIINVRELNGQDVVLDKNRPNFVLISLQDGKGDDKEITDNEIVIGLKKSKFENLKKHHWGTIIFDEVHKGKETSKTDKLLEGLIYDRLIGLSATPTKNLLRGTFSINNTHRYTLIDELKYKKLYPDIYKNPTIKNYLFNIDDKVRETMIFFEENENLTFSKFLEVSNNDLVYKNDLIRLFSWLFSIGQFNKKSNPSHYIINKSQSILLFVDNNSCQENLSNILKKLVGDIYDIYFTNSEINSSSQLLSKIKTNYVPTDKKVIIIANKQLTTGITLKYCDMVIFMNDWKSIDDYIQASYRCQSPLDGKDECFTIDLNPSRAYNIIYNYIESNNSFDKYDINKSIKDYLDCVPIFESFGNGLKQIDFEEFKSRVVETSDIGRKFFPLSVMNKENLIQEKDLLLKLGDLNSDIFVSEQVKLDDSQPDSGKSLKIEKKLSKEDKIRQTDEYNELLDKLVDNAEYLLERTNLLSLSSEFKYDNIDSIFEFLDNNPEKMEEYLKDLLID